MKQIGVVCDNYKANKYRKKLIKSGYKFEENPAVIGTTGFYIQVEDKDFGKEKRNIQKICNDLENYFNIQKRKN